MTGQGFILPDRQAWRARDAILALLAGILAAGIAFTVVGPEPGVSELFTVIIPVQSVVTVLAVAALAPRREDWRIALRARVVPGDGWGVLQGAGIQILLSLAAYWVIVELLDGSAPTQEVVDAAADAIGSGERLFVVVGLVVLGPLSEEIVFRGVLLRALEPRGRRYAVILSSIAFAALHLLDPNAVLAVPFLLVLGLILGHQTLKTGRLGRAVAIHAGFNLVTVMALFTA